MQNLLEQYKNIKPSQAWVQSAEKDLKAVMPKSQWPIYSSVIFVLVLGLSLGLVLFEKPEKIEKEPIQIKIIQERQQAEIKQTVRKASESAEKIAKKLIKSIEEQKVSASVIESKENNNAVDPKIKLQEDLDRLTNIQELRNILNEIEQDIEQGDYVIAREKLNSYLDSLKVDSEKQEIIINQE